MRRDLDSLGRLGSTTTAGLTIIQLERTEEMPARPADAAWAPRIGLQRLTRSEAEHYLTTKIALGRKRRAALHASRDHADPRVISGRSARNGATCVDVSHGGGCSRVGSHQSRAGRRRALECWRRLVGH